MTTKVVPCLDTHLDGIQSSPIPNLDVLLAIFEVSLVASESALAVELGMGPPELIKSLVVRSRSWPTFVQAANAGRVPSDWADWMPNGIGQVVMGWARREALENTTTEAA